MAADLFDELEEQARSLAREVLDPLDCRWTVGRMFGEVVLDASSGSSRWRVTWTAEFVFNERGELRERIMRRQVDALAAYLRPTR